MKIIDWESTDETSIMQLQPGGYVAVITNIVDVPEKEYLWIVYDIAEGKCKGIYDDERARANEWRHRFVRSYKATALGMFKAFLVRLQESNPNFDIASWQTRSNERELIGLQFGIIVQKEFYTYNDEDKERLSVVGIANVSDIRAGNFVLPEPEDRREKKQATPASPASAFDDDLPF